MIFRLMRLDPVVSYLKVAVPLYLFAGLFTRAIAETFPAGLGVVPMSDLPGIIVFLYACLCFLIHFALVPSSFWVRSSSLLVSLPISTRRIWIARIGSLALAVFLPLNAMSLGLALGSGATQSWFHPDPRILGWGLHTSIAWALPVLLAHLWMPKLKTIRLRLDYIAFCILSATVMFIVSVVTVPMSVATPLVGCAVLVAIAFAYRSLPGSFLLAGSTLEANGESDRSTPLPGQEAREAGVLFYQRTILRSLMSQWGTWIVLPIIVLYATVITVDFHKGDFPFLYVIFVFIWFWVILIMGTAKMYIFDPLPVRRSVIYALTMIPAVIAVLIGVGIGNSIRVVKESSTTLIRFRQCQLQIPHEFHELSRDGRPDEVVAPWGERYQPRAHSLYAGSDMAVYNPFEHGSESSVRFVGYQLDRAAERIHGSRGSGSVARFDGPTDETICDGLRRNGLTIDESMNRIPATRSKILALVLGTGFVLGCIGIAFALRARDRKPRSWRFALVPSLMLGVIAAVLVTLTVLEGLEQLELWVVGAFVAVLLGRVADAIPFGAATVWILFFILFIVGNLFVQWRFQKSEAPTKRMAKQFVKEF